MLEEPSSQNNEISLRDYVDLLRRRKFIAIQTFFVVVMVGVVVTFMTKPTYRTGCKILVEGKDSLLKTVGSDPLSPLFVPDSGHDIPTQIEVLQSSKVLTDAFVKADVPPSEVKLDIHEVGGTDVIEIVAESTRADFAERICKVVPETYRQYMTGNHNAELLKALTDSRSSLETEKIKLGKAEENLRLFKNRVHLPDVEADKIQSIGESHIAQVELSRAQTDLHVAQSRLASAKVAREKQPEMIDANSTASNNAARQAVQDRLDHLHIERTRALGFYKANAFQVQQIDTQIDQEEQLLAKTPDNVTTTTQTPNSNLPFYDQRLVEAQATVNAMQAQVDKVGLRAGLVHTQLAKFSDLDLQQARLTRDLDEHQNNLKTLTNTVQMLDLRNKATHDPLLTITPAGPATQVAPKPITNVIYAVVVGLILGLSMALLQEFLDDRINTPEDARRLLPAPALGYVPLIEKEEGRLLSQTRSSGPVLESYRALRANVRFATVGAEVTSLLVTSTVPGEGKSVTATNLAIALAMDGRKVILVDADMRRPTVHQKFGTYQSPGLTNVLVGHTSLENALRDSTIPNLKLLTAGPLPPNPAELLSSEPMQRVHERLKEYADIVIYDSPPCLATADAPVLSASVDGVLYVIQMGSTKKSAVRHAAELLEHAHANILGLIFNKIELSRAQTAYYGYYQLAPMNGSQEVRSSFEFDALLAQNDLENSEALTTRNRNSGRHSQEDEEND